VKLDFDCVRDILIAAENTEFAEMLTAQSLSDELGYPLEVIMYTAKMLEQGGYITGRIEDVLQYPPQVNDCTIYSLTFSGHEYLNSIRDKNVWTKFKSIVEKAALPFTLEISQYTCSSLLSDLIAAHLKG